GGIRALRAAVVGAVTPGLAFRVVEVRPAEVHVQPVAIEQGLVHHRLPVEAGGTFEHEGSDRVRGVGVDVGKGAVPLPWRYGLARDEITGNLGAYVRLEGVELREVLL